ncbi:MAG: diacylglycerol kinase family protein [Bacillota bacterium]
MNIRRGKTSGDVEKLPAGVPACPPKKLGLVVNPAAGNGSVRRAWPGIARLLNSAGLEFTYGFTGRPGDGKELARKVLSQGCDCVVAVGGDGTVNEVLNGLLAEDIPPRARLGIIPCGTGRDLARTLSIPRSPAGAVARLAEGRARLVDVGRITFSTEDNGASRRYFLNVADAGLGGETTARVNSAGKQLGGFLSFLRGALVTMSAYRPQTVRIDIDGEFSEQIDITTVALANGRYFGGGMFIAPQARMDDELFDVVVIRGMPRPELALNLLKVYSGRHLDHPKVALRRGRRIVIDSHERVCVEADGEPAGYLPAEFSIVPEALRVIC